ncbi:MAG: 2-oxo acid dehydrogenase subunit E2 [Nitrospirae bacterium]|nr:2-oxo acid dehydrogenase subunit E2 [Nitrospirota bacterium]MBI3606011.1 2-oxo acid dehydrogenase subunit E2 [Nitrospirota bacterium]
MAREFKFADLGEGITEGEIVKWHIREGSEVKVDQILVEIETDKAIVPIPSPYAGRVKALHGKEGGLIKVGDVLVEFQEAKKDSGSVVGILEEAPDEVPEEAEARTSNLEGLGQKPGARRVRAIPSVRALAKKMGIDLTGVKGTGPDGRIRKEDLQDQTRGLEAKEKPAEALIKADGDVERVPFRGVKRAQAKLVSESAQKIPHVTFMDKADMTRLQEVREQEKPSIEKQGLKLTFLPFIIKSVIAGLKQYPYLNSSLDESRQEIVLKKYYHIGIAVDTPDGLMVFAIKNADKKSILELAKELAELTRKAASRTIDLKDLKGSTFTLTNYGVIGGMYGTPIINYPEAAILGIGKIEDQPVIRNGEVAVRKIAPLSLSFDHRLIDGAYAGRFLNTVIEHIENPNLLLIESR